MKKLSLYIFIFFVVSGNTLIGQIFPDISFESIRKEAGLSSDNIHQIIQDNKGFLWCATFNGLNRFDGVNIRNFTKQKNGIAGNHIRTIHYDKRGYLWIGTLKNGISRYNYETGEYKHFKENDDIGSISSNQILTFFEDSKGQLWIGTENGLNLFNYEKEFFYTFKASDDPNSLSSNSVIGIAEDSRGWIWLATWAGGVNLAIPVKGGKKYKFRHFKSELNNPSTLRSDNVWRLFKDNAGRFWVGTFNGGLSLMLPNKEKNPEKFTPQFISYTHTEIELAENEPANNLVFSLNQDEKGLLWIGTANGLSLFYPDYHFSKMDKIDPFDPNTIPSINFKHFQHNSNDVNSLSHSEIRNIFFDERGIAWLSTINGVSKYDPNSIRFEHFLKPELDAEDIAISAIEEYSKDRLFLGTRAKHGLIEFNPDTKELKRHKQRFQDPETVAFNEIFCFYKWNSDTLLIGSKGGFSIFRIKEQKFTNFPLFDEVGNKISIVNVKSIFQDSKSRLWFATEAGLVYFNIKNGTLKRYKSDDKLKFVKDVPNLNSIIEDENGYLWIGAYEGLYRIKVNSLEDIELKTYSYDAKDAKSLCSDRVIILKKINNELWIGTEDGLAKYNKETDDFTNITSQDGLKITGILSIEGDANGTIWASTREGIFSVEPKTMVIRYFDVEDGLQDNTFNHFSSERASDGQLYFGGINGYNAFYGEKVDLNTTPPQVYITGIKTFNEYKSFDKDYTSLKDIEFSYKENYFTIEFSALSFTQADENQYAYKLEGFDKDWIYSDQRNFASYTNLDGGTYTFKVKAANNDGFWNEEGVELKIRVIPPFWQRYWVRLLAFLLLVGGIGFFVRRRIKQEKSRQIALEKEVATRTFEIQRRTIEVREQKKEIEQLVQELQSQNEILELKVTERTENLERINKDLLRSNKDLEQFAYVASHDLQEPLRQVGNFVQLLDFRYGNRIDQNGRDYIQFAVEGVQRMSNLIKSLLEYSRVGRSDSSFEVTDLNEVVEGKILDLQLKIKEKNAIINLTHLPKNINCEPNQIGIVFYNLINNALKFNHSEQPTIDIILDREGERDWTFSVKDNGIGISDEYQERVFEIFKRLNNRSNYEGNGIGLALCKRIINRHEGHIWFESEEGKGTTFYFTISKLLTNQEIEIE